MVLFREFPLRAFAALMALTTGVPALAQSSLLQAGPVTPGHQPMYSGSGFSQPLVQDGGGSGGGGLGVNPGELGITSRAGHGALTPPYAGNGNGPLGEHFCMYDGPTTNPTGYHYFCLDPNAQGGGLMDFGAAGGALPLPLTLLYNGAQYNFPFGVVGPSTSKIGDIAIWNNATGSVLTALTPGAGVATALGNAVNTVNGFTGAYTPGWTGGVTRTIVSRESDTISARDAGTTLNTGIVDAGGTVFHNLMTAATTLTAGGGNWLTLPGGIYLFNETASLSNNVTISGAGMAAGPQVVSYANPGSAIVANFASGDLLAITSLYGSQIQNIQFNSQVGQRTGGAAINLETSTNAVTGYSLTNLSFNNQFDDILLDNGNLGAIFNTYHFFYKDAGVKCVTNGTQEPSCGFIIGNAFASYDTAGNPSTAATAALDLHGGYEKVIANNVNGGTAGLKYTIDAYPAGNITAFFNTVENEGNYGIRLLNASNYGASQAQLIGNELLTDTATTGAYVDAMIQIDPSSTPGTPWMTNLMMIGQTIRGELTRSSGGPCGGYAAHYSIDGVNNWLLDDGTDSVYGNDTSCGIWIGPDARNGVISNYRLIAEQSQTLKKYNGTLTYTQINDMQGLSYSTLSSLAPANGSSIWCTDCNQGYTSGGSNGAWLDRINGSWWSRVEAYNGEIIFRGSDAVPAMLLSGTTNGFRFMTASYGVVISGTDWTGTVGYTQLALNGSAVILEVASAPVINIIASGLQDIPQTISALTVCSSQIVGTHTSVSNGVASPTYHSSVSTTGTSVDSVYCNYNGSTYGWVYQ